MPQSLVDVGFIHVILEVYLSQLQHLGAIGEDKLWYYCNGQKKSFWRKQEKRENRKIR